ncbi:MAG: MATE family efflux transporter [Dehalococcoidales bacterium]
MADDFGGGFSGRGGRRGGRRAAFDKDWTQGNIFRNLLLLAWPMMLGGSFNMMGPTIDMIWVGKLGTAAMAGVGISGMAVMVVNSLRMGLQTGTRAMVARYVGAGDEQGANHVAQQAFVVSAAFSIFMAAIGIFLAEPILLLLGVEADVVTQGAAYMRILFIGSIGMSFRMMSESVMQASGDSITPMRITMAFRIVHVALAPFLIFGWWIFPRLGVSGAAITNVISQGLGAAIGLWILFSGRTRLQLSMKDFRLDGNVIWRMVKVGIPASIAGAERSFANLMLMWFVVPFGTVAVAAQSLVQRIDMFIHMPTMGLGQASGVLAGQNLGAHQPERAERTSWLAAAMVTLMMAVISILIWFGAEYIVRVFNTEPELVKITGSFMRIQIVGYMVFGMVIILMQSLNGVGDTIVPMLTTLITMWGIQVPLAYVLPRTTNLGVYGVRWAIVASNLVRAAIYATYFKLGRWKRMEL